MKERPILIAIILFLSAFIISGCGISLLSMEKDNKKMIQSEYVFDGKYGEGDIDGKVENRKPLPPAEKQSMSLENTVLYFLTPQMELLPGPKDIPEELEKYLSKLNSCYGTNNNIYFLAMGYSYNVKEIEKETGVPFHPDLENGLKFAVEGIDNNILTRLHISSINDKTLWGREGKELTGNCDLGIGGGAKINCYIDGVAFSQDGEMWCVIVFYKSFDKEAERTKNLIINSIEIK